MVNPSNLTENDRGKWVRYIGHAGETEDGRIKSWNDEYIFVVYNCGGDWNNYQNYTAAATQPEQLLLLSD